MANANPCKTCEHYDPILRGMKETAQGWCVKRSLYPYRDSPGQVTPANAQRVANPNDPASPHLVEGAGVRSDCLLFQARKPRVSKADLMAQATGKR